MEFVTTQTQKQKQMKPVVKRCVAVHDRKTRMGAKRVVVIQYQLDRTTGVLTYGATIFNPDTPTQKFDFAAHAETARARFTTHPVVVTGVKDDLSLGEFNRFIRSLLYKNGCRTKAVTC